MVNLWTGASTVFWKPFTTLRPSPSSQTHFRTHPLNTACHSSRVEADVNVDPPDHPGVERPKELLEAQEVCLNRRQWMVFATGSMAVGVLDATEANAQPLDSVQVKPSLDNISFPEPSSTTAPTGIQAIRTPSINRCPLFSFWSGDNMALENLKRANVEASCIDIVTSSGAWQLEWR